MVKLNEKKFLARMPLNLYKKIQERSARESCSVNQLIIELLINADNSSHTLIEKIKESALTKEWKEQLLGVVLFGSGARGEVGAASDIDLLIVLDRAVKIDRTLYRMWDQKFVDFCYNGYPVSIHFSHLPLNIPFNKAFANVGSLWKEISIEGVVLWEREYCVSKTLSAIRLALLNAGAKRRTVHGVNYWV
jgi:hypothetical protein